MNYTQSLKWLSRSGGNWRRENFPDGYRIVVFVRGAEQEARATRESEFAPTLAKAATELRTALGRQRQLTMSS
ncbi:MAG: hypothetical protein ABIP89_13570 [Polyangiaceae bacterium]